MGVRVCGVLCILSLRRSRVGVEILGFLSLLFKGLLALFVFRAAHQPHTAHDQCHTDHDLRQGVQHQVDGAENRVILSPAPHHIAQHPHDDVVVEHDRAQRDEPPAHQLVAFAHELGHAGIVPVKVHQIIVLRGFFRRQLRAEVQGIEKAVHIHNDAADYQCVQPRGAA